MPMSAKKRLNDAKKRYEGKFLIDDSGVHQIGRVKFGTMFKFFEDRSKILVEVQFDGYDQIYTYLLENFKERVSEGRYGERGKIVDTLPSDLEEFDASEIQTKNQKEIGRAHV